MCLLVAAWRVHRRYPLLLAANRDELHARASREAHSWEDPPDLVGGRDLEAGGTWLAARPGRVAAVTNVYEAAAPGSFRSRGELPVAFLRSAHTPRTHAGTVVAEGSSFRGFNLLLATPAELVLVSNRLDQALALAPGVHAVSNARPGEDWPKAERARDALLLALDRNGDEDALIAAAFALLAEGSERAFPPAEPAAAAAEAATDPRWRSIFVSGDDYGTRCSTLVMLDAEGAVTLYERRFGPRARPEGEVRLRTPHAG